MWVLRKKGGLPAWLTFGRPFFRLTARRSAALSFGTKDSAEDFLDLMSVLLEQRGGIRTLPAPGSLLYWVDHVEFEPEEVSDGAV